MKKLIENKLFYTDKNTTHSYLPLYEKLLNPIAPPKVIYTTRSHNWSTTRIKDLITMQTIKQNPDIIK